MNELAQTFLHLSGDLCGRQCLQHYLFLTKPTAAAVKRGSSCLQRVLQWFRSRRKIAWKKVAVNLTDRRNNIFSGCDAHTTDGHSSSSSSNNYYIQATTAAGRADRRQRDISYNNLFFIDWRLIVCLLFALLVIGTSVPVTLNAPPPQTLALPGRR